MTLRRQHLRTPGFTIIEIMVSLAIFGLIVAAVYSSWMAIVRGAQVGRKAAADAQRSRIAVRTLEDSLTAARCFAIDVTNYAFVAENGDTPYLSFVAKLSSSFPRSGRFGDFDVRRVTFSLEPGPDSSRQLVLRQNPVSMDMDIDEKEHPIVLAPNVKDFKMQFWDGQSKDLQDDWTQTNQLPREVQIVLSLEGNRTTSGKPVVHDVAIVVAPPSVIVQPGWQGGGAIPPQGGPPVPTPTQNPTQNPTPTPQISR